MTGAVRNQAPSAWSVTRQSAAKASAGRDVTKAASSCADMWMAAPPKRSRPEPQVRDDEGELEGKREVVDRLDEGLVEPQDDRGRRAEDRRRPDDRDDGDREADGDRQGDRVGREALRQLLDDGADEPPAQEVDHAASG